MSDAAHKSKLGDAWGYTILLIIVVILNIIGMLSGQLNSLLSVIRFNGGVFLAAAAFFFLNKATSPKKGGDAHPPKKDEKKPEEKKDEKKEDKPH